MSTLATVSATAALAFTLGLLAAAPVIRRLRSRLAEAVHNTTHDPLTGLPNRAFAEHLFSHRTRACQVTVVALVDLDRFKDVNDTYGHQAGDDLLAAVGQRLASNAKANGGVAARLAGDEFLLILPADHRDYLHPVAASLLAVALPVKVSGNGSPVTIGARASAGITVFDGLNGTFTSVLREADIALYHAKQSGTYEIYTPGMQMPARKHRHGPRLRDHGHTAERHVVRGEVTE